eukprot:TRINITY_DN3320_c0_g3_i1.p1 TRINITY_DN3320_c0_g3~~TRINITY_DN3320_c0_g3_i1.p1  ORF type:complete len:93 (+),score=17.92 TRINITY_DN3320_c0_g3_i1:31-309(+)
MGLKLLFNGGLETYFPNTELDIPHNCETFGEFCVQIPKLLNSEHGKELIENNEVKPGIIVLIDDAEWFVMDGPETEIYDGCTLTFISTMHGG